MKPSEVPAAGRRDDDAISFTIIFRTCDAVHSLHAAPRPFGLDKKTLLRICFLSLLESVRNHPHRIIVLGDRLSEGTVAFFRRFPVEIMNEDLGNERSIRTSLDLAMNRPDSEWVYFCEDDYLHRPETMDYIAAFIRDREMLLATSGASTVRRSLFFHPPDYPDRYLPRYRRPSWIFVSSDCHWRQIDNVTFTFMAEASSLKKYSRVLRQSARGANDAFLSRRLFQPRLLGEPALCLSPVPGLSTHMHEPVMSPLGPWRELSDRYRREAAGLESDAGAAG